MARLRVANPDKLAYITQTTLSVDDTRAVIEALQGAFPDDRRPRHQGHLLRDAEPPARRARAGAGVVDVVLVVGAPNSSNSNRLREIAAEAGRAEPI